MTRLAASVLATTLLLATAARVPATLLESCCACVPQALGATTAVVAPRGLVEAAFCAETDGATAGAVAARCQELGPGYGLVCLPNIPGPTCQEQLADADIACPVAAAPAASPAALGAGLLLLAGIAALALRRR